MRHIRKFPQPALFTTWRTPRVAAVRPPGLDCTYAHLRNANPAAILEAVEDGLFAEQGGLCAYTGLRLKLAAGMPRKVGFHIEHLIPQAHCAYGQDADYANLVACWPAPNQPAEPTFGARKKDKWPNPAQQPLFVSPLRADCEARITFNHKGEVFPVPGDVAAETTIDKLGLADKTLTALRKEAIRGALLYKAKPIRLTEAQKQVRELDRDAARLNDGHSVSLRAFCFALRPALIHEIKKLEGILGRKIG